MKKQKTTQGRVIIIGGGPAGSTLGCYLSMMDIPNLIIESDHHPRQHVGESMVMSTLRVFQEIGFLDTLEESGFVHKYGASWFEVKGRESSIRFADFPMDGITQDYTYHVDRSLFDHQLLMHAKSLGSEVYQGVRVKRVVFEGDQAVGVEVDLGGDSVTLSADLIADASGRNTLLGRQLKLRQNDPIFDQYAVHSWFEDVNRGNSESADYIHIYFLPVERGWAWQIPISDSVTSMGVVAERDQIRQFRGDAEGFFNEYIKSNKALAEAMAGARQLHPFKTEGDYSYVMERFVGNGWLLVGDASRFVDPIFSSGVNIALYGAKFAADAIQDAFSKGDFSSEVLVPYEERTRQGVAVWYEFIRLYYKLLPLFTHFIRSEKHRAGVHRLLQGEVYDRTEVPVLDAMRDYITAVESNESHLLRGQLASIPIDDLPLPE